ncbi:helix-turn-helix transcriptional regulator [Alicyclobacillus dauci]|uniref:Helix-turn-helix transcriptional regulator n=1 Tax=Alicyclobacillus dauci TaxID=1475485 RepID=A0ABY6YZ69_9BACL|nr:helix-turn-helix transcriptional regulator [Alicyclobacillus dauci]WAH35914.1 helix-turn-helix transcriptional regulator [Alicyclobacillus dauci]
MSQQPDAHDLIQKFVPIAEAVAETFGTRCEVVLHDLTQPQSSVVYTKNGHVTGRHIGQSFRHLVQQVLRSKKFKNDHVSGYKTTTSDGRTVKSTTALIRDHEGVAIGAFCINFDVHSLLQSQGVIHELVAMDEPEEEQGEREIVDNVWTVVTDLIHHAVNESAVPVDQMSKVDKMRVVSFLDSKGLFLIKGAIDEVARILDLSKVTVYGYLEALKTASTEP